MYAFISNEYQGIVSNYDKLKLYMKIYTYPKFRRVYSIDEANQFIAENRRKRYSKFKLDKYGKGEIEHYISIDYFIYNNTIYANLDTSKFGYIKLNIKDKHIKCNSTYDITKLKISNIKLNNDLIMHHCIAINYILNLLDNYCNIELKIPDMSVYLACTAYTGKDASILRLQSAINSRIGKVFYTLKN